MSANLQMMTSKVRCGAIKTWSIFSQDSQKLHPIVHSLGRDMGHLLCGPTLIHIRPQSLQWCMQYQVIFNHVITAPDCMLWTRNILILSWPLDILWGPLYDKSAVVSVKSWPWTGPQFKLPIHIMLSVFWSYQHILVDSHDPVPSHNTNKNKHPPGSIFPGMYCVVCFCMDWIAATLWEWKQDIPQGSCFSKCKITPGMLVHFYHLKILL